MRITFLPSRPILLRVVALTHLLLIWFGPGRAQTARWTSHDFPDPYHRVEARRIIQSQNGLIWLGTTDGLFAYDGKVFQEWPRPDSLGAGIAVTALFEDPEGTIWVGYADGRIASWLDHWSGLTLWEPEEGTPKERITDFAYALGNLWIATYGEGVYVWSDNRLYNFGTDDGLPGSEIYCLVTDALQRTWIGTDAGLCELRFTPDRKKIIRPVDASILPDQILLSMLPDPGGGLWLGFFEGQVAHFQPGTEQVVTGPSLPVKAPITRILSLPGQELWAGTQSAGLWRFDQNRKRWSYGRPDMGEPTGQIYDLLCDRENNLWVLGQATGLVSAFRPIEFVEDGRHSVQSVHEDSRGNLWAGTPNGLFRIRFHPLRGYEWPDRPDLLPGENILSLNESSDGSLLIGTFGHGLFTYDVEKRRLTHIEESSGLTNGNILSISVDPDAIWLTTLGGIFRLSWPIVNRKSIECRYYGKEEGLASQIVYCSYVDRKGNRWFGTDGEGLSCLRPDGELVNYHKVGDLHLRSIYAIAEDRRGHLWLGTPDQGIIEYDGYSFVPLAIKEGLKDLAITGMFPDRNGRIIILHQKGMDILDPERRHLIYYNEESGLDEFDPNLNAVGQAANGVCWVGTSRGLIRYTALQKPGVIHPTTILKSASLLNGRQLLPDEVLDASENYLRFQYAGLWYTSPEKVLYRYRLEGFDLDWKETKDREVTFSALPPGRYTWRVQATENGEWLDEPELQVSFTIRPPWWRQWWFILLMLVVTIFSVRGILRFRDRRLQREAQLQRERVELQLETLKSQINPHFLFNSFNTLLGVIESDPASAARYVEELSDFFRQILMYREQEFIPLEEELAIITNYKHLLERRFGDHVRLDIDLQDRSGYVVPLTLQLLVENAVKHNVISRSSPLTIRVYHGKPGFLTVENNLQKKSVTPDHSTGFGLHILKSHYQILAHQELTIVEQEGKFTVHVPIISS